MKKIKILIIFIMFAFSFVAHFAYDIFPNAITSIFFPVNESVWEHMKIIYISVIIGSIIEYFIYRKYDSYQNYLINIPIISILGIILYLFLYYIIRMFIDENMFVSISLLFIVYTIIEIISYYILNASIIKYQKIIGLILIIASYIAFAYLTYNPPVKDLFLDKETHIYGIKVKS